MLKKLSKKFVVALLVIASIIVCSISFANTNWSYLIDLSNALSKTTTTFGRKALECYGSTMVDDDYGAGVYVLLQKQNSDGEWETQTGWSDFDSEFATICEVFAVGNGTYRLQLFHTAYEADDTTFSNPKEGHYSYSVIQTYP